MSSLPDRSDSPRWRAEPEPQQPGINWAEIVVLAFVVVADVAGVALLLWQMGVIW
jgi:hypothetical protein